MGYGQQSNPFVGADVDVLGFEIVPLESVTTSPPGGTVSEIELPDRDFAANLDIEVLHNRPMDALVLDQVTGYKLRHPDDDFVFGEPGLHSLSKEQEQTLISLWQQRYKPGAGLGFNSW